MYPIVTSKQSPECPFYQGFDFPESLDGLDLTLVRNTLSTYRFIAEMSDDYHRTCDEIDRIEHYQAQHPELLEVSLLEKLDALKDAGYEVVEQVNSLQQTQIDASAYLKDVPEKEYETMDLFTYSLPQTTQTLDDLSETVYLFRNAARNYCVTIQDANALITAIEQQYQQL